MNDPFVSVIMPVFNCGKFIREAIESCLQQTWRALEVIVVDNGSTDDSREVARSFAAKNVLVTGCEIKGASAARNVGLRLAQGDYFQFLDADDVLDRQKIEIQMRRLQAGAPLAMASGAWARFQRETGGAQFHPEPVWRDLSGPDFLIQSWLGGGMMPVFGWLTPRGVATNAGPWNESLSQDDDGEYFARVVLASAGILFCGEAKGLYRTLPQTSVSKRRDRRAMESGFRAAQLNCQNLLAVDSRPQARRACAAAMQRFAYTAYPDYPDLTGRAEAIIKDLGGSDLPFAGGWPTKLATTLFGWKVTRRLQGWRHASSVD